MRIAWLVLIVIGLSACARPGGARPACAPVALRTDLPWYGDNRAALQALLDGTGCTSPSYDPAHPPVALFDWDNTISKNDFGDALTFWLIAHGKVRQPPGQDWRRSSELLADAGATALTAACGTAIPAGQPLPTDTPAGAACADEMISIYTREHTRAGEAAFAEVDGRRVQPAYAWTAQLAAGYTHAELAAFAQAVIAAELAAPEGAVQTVGTTGGLDAWLRIYDQQKDLIAALRAHGFAVWVITASPQDVIATAAPLAGIAPDHVIGIRSIVDAAGALTATFEGCGDVPDGGARIIPTVDSKRCYVNKIVYGETGAGAWARRPAGQRWAFAAGDSDSDVEFLRDATVKLVINRNRAGLMCRAYRNEGGRWLINPMFLGPRPAQAVPYACAAFADEEGRAIPDQADTVHAAP